MTLPNRRLLNFAGFLACAGMMGFALYAQHVLMLDPCPLCILQRIATISTGFVFAAAAMQNPGRIGARIYAALLVLTTGAGVGVATWHVYIQHLPADRVPSCGPGYDYIMENFPVFDALGMIFKGSGECAEVSWRLLGLSMPSWVIIGLGGLLVAGAWNNLRRV